MYCGLTLITTITYMHRVAELVNMSKLECFLSTLTKKAIDTTSVRQLNAEVMVRTFGSLQIHSTRHVRKPLHPFSSPFDSQQAVRRIRLSPHAIIHLLLSDLLQPCQQWMSSENNYSKYTHAW